MNEREKKGKKSGNEAVYINLCSLSKSLVESEEEGRITFRDSELAQKFLVLFASLKPKTKNRDYFYVSHVGDTSYNMNISEGKEILLCDTDNVTLEDIGSIRIDITLTKKTPNNQRKTKFCNFLKFLLNGDAYTEIEIPGIKNLMRDTLRQLATDTGPVTLREAIQYGFIDIHSQWTISRPNARIPRSDLDKIKRSQHTRSERSQLEDNKFPSVTVTRMDDLPKDYPPFALAECKLDLSNWIESTSEFRSFESQFSWDNPQQQHEDKKTKTKRKRTDLPPPTQTEIYRGNYRAGYHDRETKVRSKETAKLLGLDMYNGY